MSDPQILIVGAGPTGLTLASLLQRYGVPHRLIDAKAGIDAESRALAVHARTLEVLEDLDLSDALVARGRKLYGGNIFTEGRRTVHLTFDDLEGLTRYPFVLSLEQQRTEALLESRLMALGGRVEWGCALSELYRSADSVRVRLSHAEGGHEDLDVPYLVACDGAHSACRKAVGAEFSGGSYRSEFLLADVALDWAQPPDELYAYLSESGVFFAAPLSDEGRWRVICELPEDERRGEEDEPRPPATLGDLQRLIRLSGPDYLEASDPVWLSWFRVHHRMLSVFRADRVFFAGDAAHIHSPLGGQGMNTGIQDAHNLAWKLALVTAGKARPTLLDSYDAERRPVAEEVVKGTDLLFRAVLLRHPLARQLRNGVMGLLGNIDPLRKRIERRVAMLYVDYADSPVVGQKSQGLFDDGGIEEGIAGVNRWRAFHAAPAPGEWAPDGRLLIDGEERRLRSLIAGRHLLLLFAGGEAQAREELAALADAVSARFGEEICVQIIVRPGQSKQPPDQAEDAGGVLHRLYGARGPCLYLLRPDGYVGFRAQPANQAALMGYLEEKVFQP